MKQDKVYHIYKIVCDVPSTHVVYVGKTTQTLSGRLSHHAAAQKKPTRLNKLIGTIGREHFSIELIEDCLDATTAGTRERFWIKKLDTISNGYNVRIGSNFTNEDRMTARISDRNKAVICDNTGVRYMSCSEAARSLGLNVTDVSECAARHLRQVKGYRFRYADCDRSTYDRYWSTGITRNRRVYCLETRTVYANVLMASRALGMHHTSVAKACARGGYCSRKRLHVSFCD